MIAALHQLYPAEFKMEKTAALIANHETSEALAAGTDPKVIVSGWKTGLDALSKRRELYLLYR
jgi:hypothetical protein